MSWITWTALSMVLIVGEMFTGTFYLLGFGIAAMLGGLIAWLDLSVTMQFSVVAVATLGFWFLIRSFASRLSSNQKNFDLDNMDIGKTVEWIDEKSRGVWQVRYRGTTWEARPVNGKVEKDKELQIVAQDSSILIVDNIQ